MSRRLSPPPPPIPGADKAEPRFAVGERVGDTYEIRSLLGAGGMGQVFEAFDLHLGRRVALKVVLPTVDPESLRLEGRALAAIQHPSVITVHASGVHRGIDYIVLEHVRGLCLLDYLEQRRERAEPFTVAEALNLLVQVVEGLAVVHGAGITHRDVKPGNIMLAPGNRVVLMDFGLTLLRSDAHDHERVVGSLEYMAPETLMGEVSPDRGPLIDLYAVGVMAFELLAGFVPYAMQSSAAQVERQLSHPVPDVAHVRSTVPMALSKLIRELLAPNPADRPHSAEAVLWRLRTIREREQSVSSDERFAVLVVDDDEDMHKMLSTYVRIAIPDAEIEMVTSGKQALRAVRKRVPQLILLDLGLPDVNGIEVCMLLRGMNVQDRCKIIAVSGRAGEADEMLLNQFGVSLIRKGPNLMSDLVLVLDTIRPEAASARA